MKGPFEKIVFVHEGKESYPEIAAYKAFFDQRFKTQETHPDQIATIESPEKTIFWFLMGFYRARPAGAGLVVHDYRSLSIGRTRLLKDFLKRRLNARPDIRIFQNEALRTSLSFADDVPSVLLPMGVAPDLLAFRGARGEALDFCYIGVLSKERKSWRMIDSFLRRFGAQRRFDLFGKAEAFLIARYKNNPNVVFRGRLPQAELFAKIAGARVGVNYFPCHAPHKYQTPTKMLDYAALGLRILSSEQPRCREAAAHYGINSLWGGEDDMFAGLPEACDWANNEKLDPAPFLWPDVIAASGIAALIDKKEWE